MVSTVTLPSTLACMSVFSHVKERESLKDFPRKWEVPVNSVATFQFLLEVGHKRHVTEIYIYIYTHTHTHTHTHSRVSFCDGSFYDNSLLRTLSSRTEHSRLVVHHCCNPRVLSLLSALLALFWCACVSSYSILVQFY